MPSADITALLLAWNAGNQSALDQLLPVVYDELRVLARSYLRRERADHTLQPTALVHEAYLKLVKGEAVTWQDRAHFFGIAARAMRQILVTHAEAKQAEKRGGDWEKMTLDEAVSFSSDKTVDILAVNEALNTLAKLDERQCQIVEMRFFAGLSIEETAEALSISAATVKRDWDTAKLWLRRELSRR